MPVLTMVDVMGIQEFIFSSNKLKDVIGASRLVDLTTSEQGWLSNYKANVVIAAGGNALLRFKQLEQAKDFAAYLSRKILDNADGLELAVTHRSYNEGTFSTALKSIHVDIQRSKLSHRPSVPLLGLGVTTRCRETGFPATTLDADNNPISKRIAQRRKHANDHKWDSFLVNLQKEGYGFDFPLELDDLGGSKGEKSTIGVVHIDGNGIGKAFKTWLENNNQLPEEDLVTAYRKKSDAVRTLLEKALQSVVQTVVSAVVIEGDKAILRGKYNEFSLKIAKDKKILLPIRPVILGGDDLTFIVDGRIANELSAIALRVFEEQGKNVFSNTKLTAAAGVAIVKTHSPFSRAYELSEALCDEAKSLAKEQTNSALTWHVGLSGLAQRYSASSLSCKPYYIDMPLNNEGTEQLSWTWLITKLVPSFKDVDGWGGSRNKLKQLPNELSLVAQENFPTIQNILNVWNSARTGKELQLPAPIENGFYHTHTPVQDGLELLDFYLGLGVSA